MTHFREECREHGTVLAQCRCPGPKEIRKIDCPGMPVCDPDGGETATLKFVLRAEMLAMIEGWEAES